MNEISYIFIKETLESSLAASVVRRHHEKLVV